MPSNAFDFISEEKQNSFLEMASTTPGRSFASLAIKTSSVGILVPFLKGFNSFCDIRFNFKRARQLHFLKNGKGNFHFWGKLIPQNFYSAPRVSFGGRAKMTKFTTAQMVATAKQMPIFRKEADSGIAPYI